MENRTKGAWIVHHTKKLQEFSHTLDFEDVELAGKCGLFLAGLAASDEQSTLDKKKVNAIAKTVNINKAELTAIKSTLSESQLIDTSENGEISVIGITTSNILSHTSKIFEGSTNNFQRASIELTNYSSDQPIKGDILKEYISDTYELDEKTNNSLFSQAEEIGLIDYENIDSAKIYFNGNLFKSNSIEKISKVLSSLSSEEARKVSELDAILSNDGCTTREAAIVMIGPDLLSKLQSIGMYDFSEVSNDRHTTVFLTKPSSFSKFGNPFEDDALDMAKAFISSLMYGMRISTSGRGKIRSYNMLRNTLKKLLRKELVGPCTAIGQDYQVLELSRVIQLEHSHSTRFYMRLLKFDIGRLALNVLEQGDLAETATLDSALPSSSVTTYSGPEENRMRTRRKKDITSKSDIRELISTMRN